jgi:hypothetical protein
MSNQTLTKAEIQAQKALRRKLCAEAIEQACEQYECDLVAIPVEQGGKLTAKTILVLRA